MKTTFLVKVLQQRIYDISIVADNIEQAESWVNNPIFALENWAAPTSKIHKIEEIKENK